MYRLLLSPLCVLLISFTTSAQDSTNVPSLNLEESLQAGISEHQNAIDSLQKQLKIVKDSLIQYPYWTVGGGVLSGFNFNNFSNWANRGENINSSASSFSIGLHGYANKKGENYFWRNKARVNVGWQYFKRSEEDREAQIEKISDMLQMVTHYGYNICPEIAISALSEWESNLLDQTINPSYLDLSIGMTWTPDESFVNIIHPVNYELAIANSEQFESSFGAKLVFEFNKNIEKRLSLQSNFSGFLSYERLDYLSNFTWSNGLNVKLFKGLGMGLEYALRVSQQETFELNLADEHLQSYVVMGLSYEIP